MKYRIVKDAEKAKNDPIYDKIRDMPELIEVHKDNIFFVEKYIEPDISMKKGKWKEIFSSKTEKEARTFLEWLKNNPLDKQEVIHEEEF